MHQVHYILEILYCNQRDLFQDDSPTENDMTHKLHEFHNEAVSTSRIYEENIPLVLLFGTTRARGISTYIPTFC
jgi:hypothetical protein